MERVWGNKGKSKNGRVLEKWVGSGDSFRDVGEGSGRVLEMWERELGEF